MTTRLDLAVKTDYSPAYVAKSLTALKKHEYIRETKGRYYITELGKDALKNGETAALFHSLDGRKKRVIQTDNLTAIDFQMIDSKEYYEITFHRV